VRDCVVTSLIVGVLALGVSLAVPLRASGGDTVPGRLGAATMACTGHLDLGSVAWVRARASHGALAYWARQRPTGEIVSSFGPTPAWMGALAMLSIDRGALVGDRALVRRARYAASASLGVSASLLTLSLLGLVSRRRAVLLTLGVVGSFAGAASLGQALWQQTALLPLLTGALASLAWGRRRSAWLVLTPALLIAALWVRPAACGLVAGFALATWSAFRQERLARPHVLASLALALVSVFVLTAVQVAVSGTWLPTGQWLANEAAAPGGYVLDPSPVHFVVALAGLLVSPGRGVLIFAPIVLVALATGIARARERSLSFWLAVGIGLHFVVCALFWKWWGGIAFGPRLLAEVVWTAPLVIAAGAPSATMDRALVGALVVTMLVGALGAVRYDARSWELRRDPDTDPSALWDPIDSPLAAISLRAPPTEPLADAPAGPFVYCGTDGTTLR